MRLAFLVLMLGLGLPLSAQSVEQPEWAAFETLRFESEGTILPYRLLKPANYDPQKSYPLVVFLHGAGERGADNSITLTHIAPVVLDATYRQQYPAFVLVPQCAPEYRWVETDWTLKTHSLPDTASVPMRALMQLLQTLPQTYSIDRQRCYAVGLSMGGYGVWDILMRMPDYFAAGVPICGGGDKDQARRLVDMPIWAFHGDKDKVVLPSRSRDMVTAIKTLGGKKIQYTEYKDVGHGSWKPALRETALWKWLYAQQK